MPPTDPAKPERPTMDATACFGKTSDTSVYKFADHPWWPAVARLSSTTSAQRFVSQGAAAIGVTSRAQTSMAVFRAELLVRPRLRRLEESHPPKMLPASAAT